MKREGDSVDHYSSGSEGGGISEKLEKENIGSSAHKNGHGSPNNNNCWSNFMLFFFDNFICDTEKHLS